MSMTIAARQQRLRENLEYLPTKAKELRTLEDQIAEDEAALADWANMQKSRAQRPVTPVPDPDPPADNIITLMDPVPVAHEGEDAA